MAAPIGLDPISNAKETRKTYIRMRDAPGEFRRIQNENNTLAFLLGMVIEKAQPFLFDEDTAEVLTGIFMSCYEDALSIDAELAKYNQLQTGAGRALKFFKRARWAAGTTRDVKQQLMMHIMI